jgi:hypothetical protein
MNTMPPSTDGIQGSQEAKAQDAPRLVLLLGMVYSGETEPKRGQEYRDRVRINALEKTGVMVYTLDDKHSENQAKSGRHWQTNFSDSRRMLQSMRQVWGMVPRDNTKAV